MSVESSSTTTETTEGQAARPASAVSSRRAFLGGTTAAVAAGGVLAAMPHLTSADTDLRKALIESSGEKISLDDPLIVHVSDLDTGEISLYIGERHVVVHDQDLATRLAAAAIADD